MENKNNFKDPLYIFLHIPKTGGTTFIEHLKKNSKPEQLTNYKKIKFLSKEQKQKIKYIFGHETFYGIHRYFPDREPRYIIFLRDPASRRVSQYNHDIARMNCSEKSKPSFKKWYKAQIVDEQVFLLNKKYKGIPGRKAPIFTDRFISKFKIANSKFLKMLGFKILKLIYSKRNKKKELENAKKLLNKCWFVGTTKNLDKDLESLFKKMNIKGKWKRYRTAKQDNLNKKNLEIKKSLVLNEKLKQKINKLNPYDFELYNYALNLKKSNKNI